MLLTPYVWFLKYKKKKYCFTVDEAGRRSHLVLQTFFLTKSIYLHSQTNQKNQISKRYDYESVEQIVLTNERSWWHIYNKIKL